LSSQIIFNLSFVNIQELVSCSFLDVLPQYDVFIYTYLKCAGRLGAFRLLSRTGLLFIVEKKINYSAQLWDNVENVQQA